MSADWAEFEKQLPPTPPAIAFTGQLIGFDRNVKRGERYVIAVSQNSIAYGEFVSQPPRVGDQRVQVVAYKWRGGNYLFETAEQAERRRTLSGISPNIQKAGAIAKKLEKALLNAKTNNLIGTATDVVKPGTTGDYKLSSPYKGATSKRAFNASHSEGGESALLLAQDQSWVAFGNDGSGEPFRQRDIDRGGKKKPGTLTGRIGYAILTLVGKIPPPPEGQPPNANPEQWEWYWQVWVGGFTENMILIKEWQITALTGDTQPKFWERARVPEVVFDFRADAFYVSLSWGVVTSGSEELWWGLFKGSPDATVQANGTPNPAIEVVWEKKNSDFPNPKPATLSLRCAGFGYWTTWQGMMFSTLAPEGIFGAFSLAIPQQNFALRDGTLTTYTQTVGTETSFSNNPPPTGSGIFRTRPNFAVLVALDGYPATSTSQVGFQTTGSTSSGRNAEARCPTPLGWEDPVQNSVRKQIDSTAGNSSSYNETIYAPTGLWDCVQYNPLVSQSGSHYFFTSTSDGSSYPGSGAVSCMAQEMPSGGVSNWSNSGVITNTEDSIAYSLWRVGIEGQAMVAKHTYSSTATQTYSTQSNNGLVSSNNSSTSELMAKTEVNEFAIFEAKNTNGTLEQTIAFPVVNIQSILRDLADKSEEEVREPLKTTVTLPLAIATTGHRFTSHQLILPNTTPAPTTQTDTYTIEGVSITVNRVVFPNGQWFYPSLYDWTDDNTRSRYFCDVYTKFVAFVPSEQVVGRSPANITPIWKIFPDLKPANAPAEPWKTPQQIEAESNKALECIEFINREVTVTVRTADLTEAYKPKTVTVEVLWAKQMSLIIANELQSLQRYLFCNASFAADGES